MCVYPEELNEFAEQPAGNFQGDKAIFAHPRAARKTELQKIRSWLFLNIVGLYSIDALKSLLLKLSS